MAYYLLEQGMLDDGEREAIEAYKVFKDLKKPELKNSYDEYYERCVTGRANASEKKFRELFELINE